jgi:hypothetical protein
MRCTRGLYLAIERVVPEIIIWEAMDHSILEMVCGYTHFNEGMRAQLLDLYKGLLEAKKNYRLLLRYGTIN